METETAAINDFAGIAHGGFFRVEYQTVDQPSSFSKSTKSPERVKFRQKVWLTFVVNQF
jgi:hypothetical protein